MQRPARWPVLHAVQQHARQSLARGLPSLLQGCSACSAAQSCPALRPQAPGRCQPAGHRAPAATPAEPPGACKKYLISGGRSHRLDNLPSRLEHPGRLHKQHLRQPLHSGAVGAGRGGASAGQDHTTCTAQHRVTQAQHQHSAAQRSAARLGIVQEEDVDQEAHKAPVGIGGREAAQVKDAQHRLHLRHARRRRRGRGGGGGGWGRGWGTAGGWPAAGGQPCAHGASAGDRVRHGLCSTRQTRAPCGRRWRHGTARARQVRTSLSLRARPAAAPAARPASRRWRRLAAPALGPSGARTAAGCPAGWTRLRAGDGRGRGMRSRAGLWGPAPHAAAVALLACLRQVAALLRLCSTGKRSCSACVRGQQAACGCPPGLPQCRQRSSCLIPS